jgi:hypothetical protein
MEEGIELSLGWRKSARFVVALEEFCTVGGARIYSVHSGDVMGFLFFCKLDSDRQLMPFLLHATCKTT